MTGDSQTRTKANAVFFAAIMVVSMMAAGFAVAPAAAVNGGGAAPANVATGNISGTLTNLAGDEVDNTQVSFTDVGGSVFDKNDTTDANGNYKITGIPVGNYTVRAEYNPSATFSVTVNENQTTTADATLSNASLDFDNQTYATSTDTLVVNQTNLDAGYLYTVDVHPTDSNGDILVTEYVGSSDVLEGNESNVQIDLTETISETDDYVAMIHTVDNTTGVQEGDSATPGQYTPLDQGSNDFVTDSATVTIEEELQNIGIVRGGVEDRQGISLNGIEVELRNNNSGITEDTFVTQTIDGEDGQFILEAVPNGSTDYNLVVEDADFDQYSRVISGLEGGERVDQSITLERNVNADRLTILDEGEVNRVEDAAANDNFPISPDPASLGQTAVDNEETVTLDIFTETEDTADFGSQTGELAPFDSETDEVDVTVTNVDGESLTASNITVDASPADTDANGLSAVDVSLDDSLDVNQFDEDVVVTVEAEPQSSTAASDTVDITFQADIDGTGTIEGDVSELGADEPADTQVYAVELSDFENNLATIDTGNLSAQGDAYRVVEVDNETGETSVLDARKDYLVSTDGDVQVKANASSLGFDIFTEPASGSAVELRFLESGNYQLQQYNETSGEFDVVDNAADFGNLFTPADGDDVSDTFEASEDLTYSDVEDRYAEEPASPVDETNSIGNYELFNLPAQSGGTEYVVIAGGIGTEAADDTADGYTENFRGHTTVNVLPGTEADGSAGQYDTPLTIEEIEVETIFDYDLDVTVVNEDGDEVKSDRIETGETIDVQVNVSATNQDTGESAAPEALAGQEIDLELLDQETPQNRLDPASTAGEATFGQLASATLEVEVVDGEAVATTTFEADDLESGTANISASTENDRDQVFDTRDDNGIGINDRGGQAEVQVFTTVEITGDVVNENDDNIAGAEITLFNLDTDEVVDTTVSGPGGSYVFVGIETGERYGINATALDGDGNEVQNTRTLNGGDDVEDSLGGEDIVVQGASPDQPLQDAEFSVSDLSPENATIQQGDTLTVSATVENVGAIEATQDVTLEIEDENGSVTELGSESLTLDAGNSDTVEFTLENVGLDVGDYTHSISTNDDSAEGTLTVTAADDGDNSSEVPTDWELSEDQYFAIYENGEQPGTQEISALVNDWFNSEDNTINGTEFGTQEISTAVNYWFNNQ